MNANPTIQWGQRLVVDGHAEVARIVVSPWDPAIEVSVNPRIGIDPDVAEWPELNFWRKFRFGDRLRMIELFLAAEIATYEFDCTGSSRSSDLLTDQYVAECEERGALDPIIPVERVLALREALAAAGAQAELHLYEGAGHAFMRQGDPNAFHAPSAALASQRLREFFAQHLTNPR